MSRPSAEEAETLALRALGYLAADRERILRFVALTGVDPGDMRRMASRPDFLLAVLDHLAANEAALLDFCADVATAPEDVAAARAALGGGDMD